MVPLIFAGLALGVKKIGDGGAAHHDRFQKNFLEHAMQNRGLFFF
jgi:hypothetical protein